MFFISLNSYICHLRGEDPELRVPTDVPVNISLRAEKFSSSRAELVQMLKVTAVLDPADALKLLSTQNKGGLL